MNARRLFSLFAVLTLLTTLTGAAGGTLLAGPCVPGATYDPACDVNHDGNLDIFDIQLTSGHWGQTGIYSDGAAPPCFDNFNRYVDCDNGTVTDTVTGLIWLKKADCFGAWSYKGANTLAAGLQSGDCGLTDNSSPGDWRLPTKAEWEETVAQALALGCTLNSAPSLTNRAGDGCFIQGPQQFTGVQIASYWTSTADADMPSMAFDVNLSTAEIQCNSSKPDPLLVWPVRGM